MRKMGLNIKKLLFWFLLICIPFLFIELTLRAFFAYKVGTSVLFYGILHGRDYRNFDQVQDGQNSRGNTHIKAKAEKDHTVMWHENIIRNYLYNELDNYYWFARCYGHYHLFLAPSY